MLIWKRLSCVGIRSGLIDHSPASPEVKLFWNFNFAVCWLKVEVNQSLKPAMFVTGNVRQTTKAASSVQRDINVSWKFLSRLFVQIYARGCYKEKLT